MSSPYKTIGSDGREYPGSLEELREWAREGRLGPTTWVWSQADERWIQAAERHELAWDLPRPAAAEPEAALPAFHRAGFVPRLVAFVADWMIILFLVNLVLMPWSEPLRDLLQRVQAQLESSGDVQPDLWLLLKFQLIFTSVYTGVGLVYSVGFLGRFGSTPGKRLLGLQVLSLDGRSVGFRGAFRRYCAEMLSVLTFGLGYMMVLGPERRTLHDVIAGTQVVLIPRE